MPFLGPEHDARKADSIKEEVLAQLGATAAEVMTALKPTCELRWLEYSTSEGVVRDLEQRWVCALTGRSEWRDVPVVRED